MANRNPTRPKEMNQIMSKLFNKKYSIRQEGEDAKKHPLIEMLEERGIF